ncbi:MAG TPA: glycosyltransferase family 39 protein, partial [Anaerolineae bacterium]|nr:glycosyltransferase family 39 protein [Anaerolineae bacterium]
MLDQPVGKMKSDRTSWLLILLIVLLGFAARFIHLGGDSFWFDELLTLDEARQNPVQVLSEPASHPPGLFLAEHFVLETWGSSEYALRLLSAWAGTLAIPLLYVVGSLLIGRRAGLLAAFLLAVSPFHIRYSQEARYYALQVALALAGMACLLIALKGRFRWWIGFGLAAALNAYVQFGSFLVLAGQIAFFGLIVLVRFLTRQWNLRQVLRLSAGLAVGLLVIGILYSPWLGSAVQGVLANIGPDASRGGGWHGVPIGDWLSASYFAFGFMSPILAAIIGLLSLLGLSRAVYLRRADQFIWLGVGVFLPYLLIKFVDVARAPLPKYVLIVLPAYLLATA